MTDQNKEPSITEIIDADEGLKSKRRMLTITSLISLALSLSGAKIEEANTFIFNIKFENESGIGVLLVFSILFLMVRYFNYAKPYHLKLYRLWSDRMLSRPYFFSHCHYTDELSGLIIQKAPDQSGIGDLPYAGDQLDQKNQKWSYKCISPFVRKFSYYWDDSHDFHEMDVFIGWGNYLKVISYEAKYQFESFFTHRENLDILAPYMLGIVAISSHFFHEKFQSYMNILAGI